MACKIAVIGAGSIGFTRKLTRDVLSVPELAETQFAFTDIDEENLSMVERLCRKDVSENDLPATIEATTDRGEALGGADYVINCSRIGGLEAFRHDIGIPLKYGVDQCVGDTLGPGGILYAQRNVPRILDFCRDVRERAKPGALLLNYANPNAINTWAAIDHGGVRAVGLCHGVIHGHEQIGEVLGAASKDEVDIICAGINHQTWYVKILFEGREITGGELLEAFERHPEYSRTEKVRIDVLRRFGYYSTESSGHLSEYLPWYRKRPDEIRQWADLSSWINGETGGYLRVCEENRNYFTEHFDELLEADEPPISPADRSSEHGSYIIEAIESGRPYRGHFNVKNSGTIENLPPDCIVEVPCWADRLGINVPRLGELALQCAAPLEASINVQRMALRAALDGDLTLLKQAALHDPLTAAVCNPDEVWRMVDEMLVAEAEWLPQYADEIPAARERLENAPAPPMEGWRGGAPLEQPRG